MGKNKDKIAKLEADITKLKEDVYQIIRYPDSIKGLSAKLSWNTIFDIEDSIWPGRELPIESYRLEAVTRVPESDLFRVMYRSEANEILMTIELEDIEALKTTGTYNEIQNMFNDGKE